MKSAGLSPALQQLVHVVQSGWFVQDHGHVLVVAREPIADLVFVFFHVWQGAQGGAQSADEY